MAIHIDPPNVPPATREAAGSLPGYARKRVDCLFASELRAGRAVNSLAALALIGVGSGLTLYALWSVVRRASRQIEVSGGYRDVALELGLSVDTRGLSIRGHLGERRLWVGEVMEGFGIDRHGVVRAILTFERPLGYGLELRSLTRSEAWFKRRPAVEIGTGHPALDKHLTARCDDPAALRALFTPEVATAMELLVQRAPSVALTDDEILVSLTEAPSDGVALRGWIDLLVSVAEALERARAAIPSPHALDGLEARWVAFATERGLAIEPAWPALIGMIDGRRVEVVARRELSGYAGTLLLHFRPHPELGLLVQPQRDPDGYWNVGQDIQVGDALFDPAFVVKGWDPTAVCNRLGPAARAALLALNARGPVVVDDRMIVLRGLSLDPAAIGPAMDEANAAARAMGW
jgi:hypothetical protein